MSAQTRGGGNCANALTAAARLGLDAYLVSKVGDDSIGDEIEQELISDGVKTQFLLKAEGRPSPFTYIIVDKQGKTHVSACSSWLGTLTVLLPTFVSFCKSVRIPTYHFTLCSCTEPICFQDNNVFLMHPDTKSEDVYLLKMSTCTCMQNLAWPSSCCSHSKLTDCCPTASAGLQTCSDNKSMHEKAAPNPPNRQRTL